jgi:cell pole-organizing protein PopZ
MSQAAKVQEPSMEEILASIRRIIADDEGTIPGSASEAKAGVVPLTPAPANRVSAPPEEPAAISQNDIDAMLAGFEGTEEPSDAKAETPPEAQSNAAASAPQTDDTAAETADVLELTESMEAAEEPAPSFRTIDAVSDVVFADPRAERMDDRREARSHFTTKDAESLLSDQATSAAATAFGALAHTVLTKNARTLEDLVGEMLRPMLKTWLDDNLPTIVERLVRAEIERVSRGRG